MDFPESQNLKIEKIENSFWLSVSPVIFLVYDNSRDACFFLSGTYFDPQIGTLGHDFHFLLHTKIHEREGGL